jgi:hypothetical protein
MARWETSGWRGIKIRYCVALNEPDRRRSVKTLADAEVDDLVPSLRLVHNRAFLWVKDCDATGWRSIFHSGLNFWEAQALEKNESPFLEWTTSQALPYRN